MGIGKRSALSVRFALVAVCVLAGARANAQHYTQTNLVSDQMGAAAVQDTHLVNAWGLARSSGSPWWVANNEDGTSTLYNTSANPPTGNPPAIVPLVVTIQKAPGSTDDHGVPTGVVFNNTTAFHLDNGNPARFMFVTEDGTVQGWNGGTMAEIKAFHKNAVYKGAAIASWRGNWYLYATNFSQRRIDVFDASFNPAHLGGHHDAVMQNHRGDDGDDDDDNDHDRAFEDHRIPHDFAPFNVQNIGGDLYVTFAKRDPATNDDVKGAGFGYVDVFSPSGRLLRRLQHGDWLNAPWGLALAPGDFGAFTHNLLVGQFGSGEIAAYDVATGKFLGKVRDKATDMVLVIDGLWALGFGNGALAGPLNTLFFTAGPDDESHGLFGSLIPDPAEQLLGNGM
jgi:uncharacterized protein (TIGR03118 family)